MADEQDELISLVDALAQGRSLDPDLFERLFPPDFAHRTLTRVEQVRAMLAERFAGTPPDTVVDVVDTVLDDPFDDDMPLANPLHTPLGQHTRYGLGSLLGSGGVAEVYLARDRRLARNVALKALRPEIGRNARNRQRFIAESQITARLAHPGIIPVHDAGKLADGRLFFTMQRVEGRTLRSVIEALRKGEAEAEAQFSLPRLMSIFQRVCMTVAYAHHQGVIHRDLKPENILIGPYGEVYVADWGLSRPFDEAEPDERLTREGEAIGTLYYMAPEQACGELSEQGPGLDVWALGVILFELLTLGRPFVGRSIINLVYVIATDPPRPAHEVAPPGRTLPRPLVELVDAALIKDVAERTLSAREMADGVAAWLDGVETARRRQEEAATLLAEAREAAAEFRALEAEVEARHRALRAEQAALPADATEAARRALWARMRVCEGRRVEVEQRRAGTIERAMRAIDRWETDEAHQLVADLYWARAEALRAVGDRAGAVAFEALAGRHDRGALVDRMAPTGRIEVARGTARMRVFAQRPLGPLRVDEAVRSADGTVPVGSYVIEVDAPGCLPARVPLVVEGNRVYRLRVAPPPGFAGAEAFVFVQGGPCRLGGDPDAPCGLEAVEVELDAFLIGRHPVTLGEYADFLDALAADDAEAARARAPRAGEGRAAPLVWDEAARRWVPGEGSRWVPRCPVTAIDRGDALAYCRWRSGRDGATIRLPTEHEWEYAARGADGRVYAWGDGFEPGLRGPARSPGPVGACPGERSPFGVEDLAGLVAEWTAGGGEAETDAGAGGEAEGPAVQRGAPFDAPAAARRAAARRLVPADRPDPRCGFRVVRELPESARRRGTGAIVTIERSA